MRRRSFLLAVLVLLAGCATTVAPPPVVIRAPQYVWVPQWGVYVLDGHDIVYHEGHHYYWHNGRWFVSRSPEGPWAALTARPVVLANMPPGHFQEHLASPPDKKLKPPRTRENGAPPQ